MYYINSLYKKVIFLTNSYKTQFALFFIWCSLWVGIGSQMHDTFNIELYKNFNFDFLRGNLIFYIFCFLFINFLYKPSFSWYLIFAIYPIFGLISYFQYNNDFDLYFGMHHGISLLCIVLFIHFINQKNIDKFTVFKTLHKLTIFILIVFFIFFILPDLINKIYSLQPFSRGNNTIDINLSKNVNIHIPQNSNGASRIILILLLLCICFFDSYINYKFSKKILILFFIINILAFFNIYYSSKLNIFFFIFACFFIFIFNNKKKIKTKIFSLIVILIIPFSLNYIFVKSIVDNNYQFIEQNRIINNEEGVLSLKKNVEQVLLSLKKKVEQIYKKDNKNININININTSFCSEFLNGFDKFTGGRACGWEILIKSYIIEKKILGKGFFSDRNTLKDIQKISSNSYIFALYNAGLIGIISLMIFYLYFFFQLIKIFKNNVIFYSVKGKFYFVLGIYLLIRSIFEDTMAFFSIDLLLLITCIAFINYFLANRLKRDSNNS